MEPFNYSNRTLVDSNSGYSLGLGEDEARVLIKGCRVPLTGRGGGGYLDCLVCGGHRQCQYIGGPCGMLPIVEAKGSDFRTSGFWSQGSELTHMVREMGVS